MRLVMSRLVQERTVLGDRDPIVVTFDSQARRAPSVKAPRKRHLVAGGVR